MNKTINLKTMQNDILLFDQMAAATVAAWEQNAALKVLNSSLAQNTI